MVSRWMKHKMMAQQGLFPSQHTFHIPVMGLAFTIDSPVKVARFGISSVVSIVGDGLVEDMRKHYSAMYDIRFDPILEKEVDFRARRITAYLNLLQQIVQSQMKILVHEAFDEGNEICKYFELLPESAEASPLYRRMKGLPDGVEKSELQAVLRQYLVPGAIDVNIMTKVDKTNYAVSGEVLPAEDADAMAALRGFALSTLQSSVVFSAGMNPRLYSYCESFADFFPNADGELSKKIILKVSDFRSAMIQGKFLAKKGLWVSEFRIESGLNCGGHAFASEGFLLAPILEEFHQKKDALTAELLEICNNALVLKGLHPFLASPEIKLSVQGGIGTHNEHEFLRENFAVDSCGWGSPFLLVPEATTVDADTLHQLETAKPQDYYLSNASPLGVPFNNLRNSSAEMERIQRIDKGRPGSPCYNKYLSFDTEFTEKPICLASREYQNLKIKQILALDIPSEEAKAKIEAVTEKECICNGLATPAYLNHELKPPHKLKSVSICPGPNLAYFSKTFSLREMVDHIYGRENHLNEVPRPNFFVNEAVLYLDYFKKEIAKSIGNLTTKQANYLKKFKENLLAGMGYCKTLEEKMVRESNEYRAAFLAEIARLEQQLTAISLPEPL